MQFGLGGWGQDMELNQILSFSRRSINLSMVKSEMIQPRILDVSVDCGCSHRTTLKINRNQKIMNYK